MSTPTDVIEVNIGEVDDKAAKGAEAAAEPAAEKVVLTPEVGIEKLREQLAEQTRLRVAAEERASNATASEANALKSQHKSNIDAVANTLAAKRLEGDALEAQHAEALAAQDWPTVSKIQRKMADNSAAVLALETGKSQMEKAPPPIPRAPIDKVDQFCEGLSPTSEKWVRAHPEWVRDDTKREQLMAAHEFAIKKKLTSDTPAYFASLERTLDITSAAEGADHTDTTGADDPMKEAAKEVRAQPAAAPVTRNNGGSQRNIVKLSAAEVEIAQASGLTPEEYAQNKVALQKEGKLQ